MEVRIAASDRGQYVIRFSKDCLIPLTFPLITDSRTCRLNGRSHRIKVEPGVDGGSLLAFMPKRFADIGKFESLPLRNRTRRNAQTSLDFFPALFLLGQ